MSGLDLKKRKLSDLSADEDDVSPPLVNQSPLPGAMTDTEDVMEALSELRQEVQRMRQQIDALTQTVALLQAQV
jgi:hypothetical protein